MPIKGPNLEQYTPFPGGEGFQPLQPLAPVEEFYREQADKAVSDINTTALLQRIRVVLEPLETRILTTLEDRSKYGQERRIKPTEEDPSNRETAWRYPREPKPEDIVHQSVYRYLRADPPVWARWRPTRHGIKKTNFNVFFYKGKTEIHFPEQDHEHKKGKIVLGLTGDGEHVTKLVLTSSFGIWEPSIRYPKGRWYNAPKVYTNALMRVLEERYKNENSHRYGMIGVTYNLGDTPSVEFSRDNYFNNVTGRVLTTSYEFNGVGNNLLGRDLSRQPLRNLTGEAMGIDDLLLGLAGAVQLFDPTKLRYYTLRQQINGEAR